MSHSFQEEKDDKKNYEDQVTLLQEKVESIQKQLGGEQEHHEKETQIHEQVIKEYEKEILQQKREHIQNEEKIAALTEQHEEVTGLLKHKAEQYEELQSGYILFAYDLYMYVIFSHV